MAVHRWSRRAVAQTLAQCSRSRAQRQTCLAHPRHASSSTQQWFTDSERANETMLLAAKTKFAEFTTAQESSGSNVQEQIERSKTMKKLGPLAAAYSQYATTRKALADIQPHLSDPDPSLREMFETEKDELLDTLDEAISQLPLVLLPAPATASLPVMMSINAAVGGTEAALFAEELARMYTRFAEHHKWKIEEISKTEGGAGKGSAGLREITLKFEPPPYGNETDEVYGLLRWEKGVHRVQRVPATESQGRVHTSTAAVIVMPIYQDTVDEPLVDPKDVKSEVMRSSGAGGQHVNKTESAIRLTHIPTGITVSMQDSRSQHQNRAWAWDVLRARLSELKHTQEVENRRASRQSQVKSADRSDKVRTYNFPQDRVTDHRIGLNYTGIKGVLDGEDLGILVQALREDFNARRLSSVLAGEDDFDE